MPKLTIPRIVTAAIACLTAAFCHAGILSFHKNSTVGKRMIVCKMQSEGVTLEVYRWRLLSIMGEKALPLGDPTWQDNTVAVISKDKRKTHFLLYGMTGDPSINFDNFEKASEININELSEEKLRYYRDKDEPSNAACASSALRFDILILFSKGMSWDGGATFYANELAVDQSAVAKNWGFIQNEELIKISMPSNAGINSTTQWPLPAQMTGKLGRSARSVNIVDDRTVNIVWPLVMPIAPMDANKSGNYEYYHSIWSREPSLLATYQITRGQKLWKLISLEQVGPLDVPEGMELILPKTVPLKKSYQPSVPKQ